MKSLRVGLAALAALVITASTASAQVFVGSWKVDDGPWWSDGGGAAIMSGTQTAAFLFGGSASDYYISTIDANTANINHLAWYSTYGGNCGGGFPCGTAHNENSFVDLNGNGIYDMVGEQSAYVGDWAQGEQYRNYAFRVVAAPEPATIALMATGLIGVFGIARKRRQVIAE